MLDSLHQLRGQPGLALGHTTIDLMGDHNIPPSSQNYEIWLSYKLGGHPDLRRRLEEIIAAGQPFSDDLNAELHEMFFTSERFTAQLLASGESIAREINEVIVALQSAGQQHGDYSDTLDRAAAILELGIDTRNLRELVAGLAAATVQMAQNNRALTSRLQDSSREMETLRETLIQVRAESMSDGLTGLFNRKALDQTLRAKIKEARAGAGDLCLIMCDIDHFKRFNDTWGHQTGDQIIRFIATTLRKAARESFCVARYGGEEFAVVMPSTGLTEANTLAESIRSQIESKKLFRKSTGEDLGKITISMGIARLRGGESMEALMERADACLYASKRGGRNRITTDADPSARSAA
ncbi:MAG: GGDEF domain-containing protein [Caulobacterales bacterium]